MTPREELEALRRLADLEAKAAGQAPAGQIPIDTRLQAPKAVNPPTEEARGSLWGNLRGAGEAGLGLLTAIPASLYGTAVGLSSAIRGGKFGSREAANEAERVATQSMQANTFAPRTPKGIEYSNALSGVLQNAIPLGGLPAEMAALTRAAPVATRAVKDAAIPVIEKTGAAVRPTFNPELTALARKAQERGIELRPDMLWNSKFARFVGEGLEHIPGTGNKADKRQVAFNRWMIDILGGDTNESRLTTKVYANAMNKSGETIGEISRRTPVPVSGAFKSAVDAEVNRAIGRPLDVERAVTWWGKEIADKTEKHGGVIPGEVFRELNSEIGRQIRESTNGDVKAALSDFQEVMLDNLSQHLAKEDVAPFMAAKKQYAVGKTIEPLIAKEGGSGDISPSKLMGVVTRSKDQKHMMAMGLTGELGDAARVAEQFLREPAGKMLSIAERAAGYGALGGAATAAGFAASLPAAAITGSGLYGIGTLYNRLGPKITRAAVGKNPPKPVDLPVEWTTLPGVWEQRPVTPKYQNRLGDVTPEWQTAPGAAGSETRLGIGAEGLYPAVGDAPLVPTNELTGYKPQAMSGMPSVSFSKEPSLANLVPDWETVRGFEGAPTASVQPTNLFRSLLDEPIPSGRRRSRPQMPLQPGIPGVDDVAIAGSNWVDAASGAPNRLAGAPAMPAVVEFQRLAAMPDSVNKILMMADFAKRHPELMTLFHPDPSVMKWPRN